MDESEARGPVRRCEDYLEYDHWTRDCTKNKDGATSTTARGITMSKKLTAVMDKIGTHGV
ncbi:hypothetical protein E2562_008568 [Oryza meyeriana var. granulata]|uniref:Uncharacterized protein n=1 Tax=Oryza meyeriana var. granulata TaxID=110450 RepID=A0A6G1C4X7_9ORYZ|nr:hypothetical protein E2562_008568 [Oryza meyeriana var. granulata]